MDKLESNLYNTVKVGKYLRIFCTLTNDFNKKTGQFQSMPLKGSYGFCMTVIFSIMISTLYHVITKPDPEDKVTQLIIKILKIVVAMLLIFVQFLTRDRSTQVLNKMLVRETEIERFGIQLTSKDQAYLILMKKYFIIVTFLLSNLGCIFLTSYSLLECAVTCITYNLTYIISSIILTQFCVVIIASIHQIDVLNISIRRVMKLNGADDYDNKPANKLRIITKNHYVICDLMMEINRAFDVQLFLIIVRTSVEFVNSLHTLSNIDSIVKVGHDLFWSVLAMLELVFLIYVCRIARKTVTRTSHILNSISAEGNQRFNSERDLFLLQMAHKKLEFSANGFFSIDNSMFLRLITTSLAYLVIIVQFERGYKNK